MKAKRWHILLGFCLILVIYSWLIFERGGITSPADMAIATGLSYFLGAAIVFALGGDSQ